MGDPVRDLLEAADGALGLTWSPRVEKYRAEVLRLVESGLIVLEEDLGDGVRRYRLSDHGQHALAQLRRPAGRAPLEVAEVAAQRVARRIRDGIPPGWGFCLWLATLGERGYSTYVSTLDRGDVVRMIQEWLAAVAGGADGTDVRASCWCCGIRAGLRHVRGGLRTVVVCGACLEKATGSAT